MTALDNESAQLRCMCYIPKYISGDALWDEIIKLRDPKSPKDANRQGNSSAIGKDLEVTDWYDVTKQVVAWSRNSDGDWVLGPQAVTEKRKRTIPSKAILKEMEMQGSEFDAGSKPIRDGTHHVHARSAYFVAIDEFELFKIQVNDSGVDVSLLKEQIKGISLAELKKRRFSDEDSAKKFAEKHLPAFYKKLEKKNLKDSEYFEIKAEEGSARVAKIQDALVTIFVNAQREDAVLIFCDLFMDRASTKIVERAITMAHFNGPILNFSIQKSLVNPEIGAKKYTIHQGGELVALNQRLLSRLVTHSFAIDAEEANDQIHAAVALATKIAGVHHDDEIKKQITSKKNQWKKDQQALESQKADDGHVTHCCSGVVKKLDADPNEKPHADRISDAVCILVSGSLENLKQVAEAAGHKMCLLVLEGSGKLCDSLPDIYRSRNSLQFNAFDHCDKLIADCGLLPDSVDRLQVCALLTRVLQTDGMVIHNLASGVQALQRSWAYVTVLADDQAMINAIERRNVYRQMAKTCSLPSQMISIVCILMSFAITIISTVQAYLNSKNAVKDESIKNITQTLEGNATSGLLNLQGSNSVLHYLIVVLPVVLSVLSNVRQDWNWGPKVVAFTYCAAVVDSELFCYKTRAGEYSDSKVGKGALDAASGCSGKLSTRLVQVSACLSSMGFVPPDPDELVPKSFTERISEALGSVFWICICACSKVKPKPSQDTKQASLADNDPDSQDETMSVDKYLKTRVKTRAVHMHREASRLNVALSFYKAYIYTVSASSSILGLLSFEVCSFKFNIYNFKSGSCNFIIFSNFIRGYD